jgi:hypothetical protein
MALTVAGLPETGGAADWRISGRVPMVFLASARYNWGVDEDDLHAAAADLRDLLRDIPEWRLAPEDWPKVQAALRAASSAAGAGDAAQLQELVADLELLSPLRMQARPGTRPLPTSVPEEVNLLVHEIELELDAAASQSPPGKAEESNGGRPSGG